jgi:hypothetical protein
LLPLDVIMQNGFKTMQDYRAGADQDIVALKLFGRNVGDVVETMLMMPAALQRAKDLQKELGIEWGPDKQAQVKAYQLEVGAFQVVLGHIGEEIGMAVMPQLMTLAKYFNDVGPSAAEFIIKAVKLVIATIDALATGAKEDYLIVKGTWDNLVVAASALWAGMKDAFETGGTNISNIWADMNKRILKNTLETNAAVLGLEHDLILRLNALDETHTSKPGAIPGFGSGGKSAPTGKPTGPASEVADWDKALKAAQDYYNDLKDAQGSFERWSESMTRDYWQEVLDNFKLSADDRAALDHKMHEANNVVRKQEFDAEIANLDKIAAGYKFNYAERIRLAEQAAAIVADKYGFESAEYARASAKIIALQQQQEAQEQRLADLARKRIETIANFEYQTKLNGLNQQLALRQINVQQELALEQQYLDEKLAIDIKAINDEIAAAGPEGDPVKLQALNDKKLQLELQYQTAKTAIANKAEQDRMQYVLQAEQAVENTFSTMLSDLMNRTKSWKDVMLDAVASITKALNDLVAKKLAQQIFGAGTGGNDILGSIFGSLFGAGGGSAAAAGSALDNPFLSIFGGIASYDVGTPYVPRDTLALVHRGEAIIPAAQNKGRPGGSPLAVTNHFHITGPVDSRTQDQIAAAAARATQRAMYRTL